MRLTGDLTIVNHRAMEWMHYAEKNSATGFLNEAMEKIAPPAISKHILISSSDMHGTIIGVSQGFCELSGFQSSELIGHSFDMLSHPQMPQAQLNALWETIKTGNTWIGRIINRTKNGGFFWVEAEIFPLLDHKGTISGYIAIYQDITELKSLENLSVTDPMTNAYNRRYFEQVVPIELARARRDKNLLCFLMADADHFKRYNDTYGHFAGDNVIKAAVDTLHETFQRPSDFIFRLGGEEFAALYSVKTRENALELANEARQKLYDRNIEHTGNQPSNRVTVSIGLIVIEPDDAESDIDSIYKYSDIALYRAKEGGRNRVALHGDVEAKIDLF